MKNKKKLILLIEKELQRRKHLEAPYDWLKQARPSQIPPSGDWRVWLILAGRGFGKTRTGAETVRSWVHQGLAKRIALIGKNLHETRFVMVEGVSGLLSIHPPSSRPTFFPSKRQLVWSNKATAMLYGGDTYEQLRGPQFDLAWIDEFAKFEHQQELLDQVMLGLRLGSSPKCIITTTPRPSKVLLDLLTDPLVAVTRGTTFDNKENLATGFLHDIIKKFEGTRLGAQELYAEILTEREGTLWQRSLIHYAEPTKTEDGLWNLTRIVIAIDPADTATKTSDETGIIVAGINEEKHAFVLADLSGRMSPTDWGNRVVKAYWHYRADRVIAEVNKGGDLVEKMLHALDARIAYKAVRATRGKAVRAEPIAALYERGHVSHMHVFSTLETQLCEYCPDTPGPSPDRMDALVWALTELFLIKGTSATLKIWKT